MQKQSLILCFILLFCVGGPALADNEINGFASIVAGKVIEGDEYLADYTRAGVYDRDISFSPDSLLGIQLRSTYSEKLSLIGQFVAFSASDDDAEVDALYLNYFVTPKLSVQAGRKQLPLYYYSDYFDVGFAYYWIRPPSDLYTWQITNYNGVSLLYETTLGRLNASLNVYAGSEKSEDNNLLSLLFGVEVDETWKRMIGAVGSISNEWVDIRLSYMEGLVNRKVNNVIVIDDIEQQFLGLSVNLTLDDLLILSEFNHYEREANEVDVDAVMISLGYQVGDFTPHITHSYFEQAINSTGNDEKHHTNTIGIRWDITESSALKIQYDDFVDEGVAVPIKGDSKTITIGMDIVF